MAEQYDVSPQKRKILEENAKRRLVLRNEFLKLSSDPFRHASGEGGAVFNPAIQRYIAMQASCYEHFRPTAKNAGYGFFLAVLPILGYTYLLHVGKAKQEASFRRGEVAYKDRDFKFV